MAIAEAHFGIESSVRSPAILDCEFGSDKCHIE
jgi:hypothetical protein